MSRISQVSPDSLKTGIQVLELANQAYDLYIRQDLTQQRRLLDVVLSNCSLEGEGLKPSYRRPFDLLAKWSNGSLNERTE